jgi:hypothetical protein
MIESILEDLSHTWGWTIEETNDVRKNLAHYAICALMDSSIAREAENITTENVD